MAITARKLTVIVQADTSKFSGLGKLLNEAAKPLVFDEVDTAEAESHWLTETEFPQDVLDLLEDEVYLGELSQINVPEVGPAFFDHSSVVKEALYLDQGITSVSLLEAWKTRGKKLSAAHRKKISDALKARALLKGKKLPPPKAIGAHVPIGLSGKKVKKPSAGPGTAEMKKLAPLGHYVETKHGKFKVTKHVTGYVYVEGGPGKLVKHSDILKVHSPDLASSAPLVAPTMSATSIAKTGSKVGKYEGAGSAALKQKHPTGSKVLYNGQEYEVVGHTTGYVEVKNGPQKYLKHDKISVPKTDSPSQLDFTVKPSDYDVPSAPKVKGGMPDTTEGLTVKGSLGGSTGAKLVEDASGTKYVMKHGNSKEHVAAEAGANDVYAAAGVTIPKHKLTKDGAQLTEFLDGAKSLGDLTPAAQADAYKQLGKHFVLDAVLGNRDVVGPDLANVMVKDGIAYRIDNGASFDFRAQGGKKEFGPVAGELQSLRNANVNPTTAKVYAHLTDSEIHQQALDLQKNKKALLDATPEQYRETLGKRIDDAVEKTKPKSTEVVPQIEYAATPTAQKSKVMVGNGVEATVGDQVEYHNGNKYTIKSIDKDGALTLTTAGGAEIGPMPPTSFTKPGVAPKASVGDTFDANGATLTVTKVNADGSVYVNKPGIGEQKYTAEELNNYQIESPKTAKISGYDVKAGTTLVDSNGAHYAKITKVHPDGDVDVELGGQPYKMDPAKLKAASVLDSPSMAVVSDQAKLKSLDDLGLDDVDYGDKPKKVVSQHGHEAEVGDAFVTPTGYKYQVTGINADGSVNTKVVSSPGGVGLGVEHQNVSPSQINSSGVEKQVLTTTPAAVNKLKAGATTGPISVGDEVQSYSVKYVVTKVHPSGKLDIVSLDNLGQPTGNAYNDYSTTTFTGHIPKNTGPSGEIAGYQPKTALTPTKAVQPLKGTKEILAAHPVGSTITLKDGTTITVTKATTGYVYADGGKQKMYKMSDLAAKGAVHGGGEAYFEPDSNAVKIGLKHSSGVEITAGMKLASKAGTKYEILGKNANGTIQAKHVPSGKIYDTAPASVAKWALEGPASAPSTVAAPIIVKTTTPGGPTTFKKYDGPTVEYGAAPVVAGTTTITPATALKLSKVEQAAKDVPAATGYTSTSGSVKYDGKHLPNVGQAVYDPSHGQTGVVKKNWDDGIEVEYEDGSTSIKYHSDVASTHLKAYNANKVGQTSSLVTVGGGTAVAFGVGKKIMSKDPEFMSHWQDLDIKLSTGEKAALKHYTGEGEKSYKLSNDLLRYGTPKRTTPSATTLAAMPKVIKDTDAALAKQVTNKDMFIFRGTTLKGFDFDKGVGAVITDLGYSSTSTRPDGTFGGNVKYEIFVPKGTSGAYVGKHPEADYKSLSSNPGEDEFLLPRGARMRVHEIVKGNVPIIRVTLEPFLHSEESGAKLGTSPITDPFNIGV